MIKSIHIPIVLLIYFSFAVAHAETIRIATDDNKWYPYSYEENRVSMGMHIDIVSIALKNLGYNTTLTPLPWKRCLFSAQTGKYDAIISASYQLKRADYLHYPHDAATTAKSEFRITQVTYVIVTNSSTPYEYDGNVKSLPGPVMAPFGYSVADDLKAQGVIVFETAGDVNSFKILTSRNGCIVTLPEIADMMMQKPEYKGKLTISKKPFKSKSYFLAFSKKTTLSKNERSQIWNEIKTIRKNEDIRMALLKKYCLK